MDSDDEDFDDSACPPGLDPSLFARVCMRICCRAAHHLQVLDLREQRLDVEEQSAEEKKLVDTFKKDADMFSKKEKALAAAVESAERDLTLFQLDKQRKLNELNTIVPIKMHQVMYFGAALSQRWPLSMPRSQQSPAAV